VRGCYLELVMLSVVISFSFLSDLTIIVANIINYHYIIAISFEHFKIIIRICQMVKSILNFLCVFCLFGTLSVFNHNCIYN